jgi:hypothetical protein
MPPEPPTLEGTVDCPQGRRSRRTAGDIARPSPQSRRSPSSLLVRDDKLLQAVRSLRRQPCASGRGAAHEPSTRGAQVISTKVPAMPFEASGGCRSIGRRRWRMRRASPAPCRRPSFAASNVPPASALPPSLILEAKAISAKAAAMSFETGRKLAQPRPTALAQASRISRARSAALTLLRVDRRKLHLEGIERLAANDAPSPQESSVLGSLSSRSGRQGDIASPPTLEAHAGASQVGALSLESRRPLSRNGRATFGQAARFSGVAPGAASVHPRPGAPRRQSGLSRMMPVW